MINNDFSFSSSLIKPQSLQELYRTYFQFANRCQFTALLRNYIQNEEWKDKSQEKIWETISKISDDIGSLLTDEIVNYTRHVVDINTCKVPQLIEQCKSICYNLEHIKNSYEFLPLRIRCLVDIFSVNSEYLIGNSKNHILSDKVIKEILSYIKKNSSSAKNNIGFSDIIDTLIDDPHGILDDKTYREFIQELFYASIIEELTAGYSSENTTPIVFNLLWQEIKEKESILENIESYRSWVDKYISNEIEHPLNDQNLPNTIWNDIERVKTEKKMSSKFNPFKISDHIYFHGLNPTNKLSDDELDLVEQVIDYHSKPKYDYENQRFLDDQSTQFAYYKELEFCEYIKMIMFIMNNINNIGNAENSYDVVNNIFIQTSTENAVNIVRIFKDDEADDLIRKSNGSVALNKKLIMRVAKFLTDYAFNLQQIRENAKTIALKHSMRGTAGLLAHVVNDYLIKELPNIRDNILEEYEGKIGFKFQWEIQPEKYLNYGNVKVIEYMDDNEYFNIDPEADVRYTYRTNARYWEKLADIGYDESLGVFTKREIHDFYRNMLGIGRLRIDKPSNYDDIQDFLVDLFRIGANPISYSDGEFKNPIDDIISKSEEDFGYTKEERLEVQNNVELRKNQERQFVEYFGNEDEMTTMQSMYDFINNRIFYYKNMDYSSHVLHPFMYNLKLWNRLDNIIINGYKDYMDSDIESNMSSKAIFDEIVGKFGETRRFWKYNIVDMTGYTTRYESATKNQYLENGDASELTGYDGLFYPDSALQFLQIYREEENRLGEENAFKIPDWFYVPPSQLSKRNIEDLENRPFIKQIYSVYWQVYDEDGNYYTRWYSHLNYGRREYQKIAIQMWYWRKRLVEMIRVNYPITKYCLDIQGNSLILVETFKKSQLEQNRYLIDLTIQQERLEYEISGNKNIHVPFCENKIRIPNELWIRWKSNPLAFPAFDVKWDIETGDSIFDSNYRGVEGNVEFGQLTHSNNDCNDTFHVIIKNWKNNYQNRLNWQVDNGETSDNEIYRDDNRLPIFFDMEQSANVLVLASWNTYQRQEDGIVQYDELGNEILDCFTGKNPCHVVSTEYASSSILEYNFTKYASDSSFDIFQDDYVKNREFDAYHYCQANGNILIPTYRFECQEGEGILTSQKVDIDMWFIPAQTLKNGNFTATKAIFRENRIIDLNSLYDYGEDKRKYLFDNPILVCRNTNLVFSTYDSNMQNKVKCAFLGIFNQQNDDNQMLNMNLKFNSCDAATRYEHDSQSELDLGLTKSKYHQHNRGFRRNYIDQRISYDCFNSYDSLDKFVFMLDFLPTVDDEVLFNSSQDIPIASAYNILSDSGYIPHFAYQSLVKYSDDVDGTSYTWRNAYLKQKDHLQFELLGLDDKSLSDAVQTMQKMVVDDMTDDCKTLICPQKLIDEIYRIWEQVQGVKEKESDPYQTYFKGSEYIDYDNPKLTFDSENKADWIVEDGAGNSFELATDNLDEYYITIVRCENNEILNEKRYILPPTPITRILLDSEEYLECDNLMEYASPSIQDNHYVKEQVIFTGTQNPFNFRKDGTRILSKAEKLQYGNGILGVDQIQLKLDISTTEENVPKRDEHGNIIAKEYVENGKIKVKVESELKEKKYVKPSIRFIKTPKEDSDSLIDRLHNKQNTIEAGQVKVIISRRNMDDIAKYHILNTSSNLYYNSSLTKNNKNEFKYADFKFDVTVHLKEGESKGEFISEELDDDGEPLLRFKLDEVYWYNEGTVITENDGYIVTGDDESPIIVNPDQSWGFIRSYPPYCVEYKGYKWFLEQDALHNPHDIKHVIESDDELVVVEHSDKYDVPEAGNFKWAHKVKYKPTKYLDYLYVNRGRLSFKISEESNSFSDLMSKIPPFHVDEVLKNKLNDLNDVQILQDYSTFVHQSESPTDVQKCDNFNPLQVKAILNYGVEQRNTTDEKDLQVIRYNFRDNDETVLVELNNSKNPTTLQLVLEDGEVDDALKIYANFTRVEDKHGDFHYDLYFNLQNLFNSPFEYISSTTKQPNVLIIPDSYLYLSGDKYKETQELEVWRSEVDQKKMDSIKQGGELSLYGQVKTYSSNDVLSDVKTIKLFTYRIYNISDDKPKFLIRKVFDITKSAMKENHNRSLSISFRDVMWPIDEDKFTIDKKFNVLNQEVIITQPIEVNVENYSKDDDFRIKTISFDIVNDAIDFKNTPELCEYRIQARTLNKKIMGKSIEGENWGKIYEKPYYDHWSDNSMKLEMVNGDTPRLTLNMDSGFNFEKVYLRWRLPKGCKVMDTLDRLGGYVFTSTAQNVIVEGKNEESSVIIPKVDIQDGHVTARVKGKSYLGMEHSTTHRIGGYVISNLRDEILAALQRGDEHNPTLDRTENKKS